MYMIIDDIKTSRVLKSFSKLYKSMQQINTACTKACFWKAFKTGEVFVAFLNVGLSIYTVEI